ncbi:NUDIX hydrolase [Halobacillus yeomjeoni]|uniref:NUDIX hydrolase n=1 Tax=Halobacillus yeomjeoni TaxID=311194 RepID=A0A931HU06_9BACI|nr:NUDIX hydrolase [Halobacillus yeomjeoni]MBH0229354.1 NUDIX hydrolase [Halobacillus yeomjeoni]
MIRKLTNIIPNYMLVFLYKTIPTSKKMKDFIMRHTNHQFLVAVLAIIKNKKGEVLLLNHTYRSQPLGIPSGWMEREQPKDALERELMEETGLKVEIINTLSVTYDENPKRIDILLEGVFVGGDFKASSEVTDYSFYCTNRLPDSLPEIQHELIKKYA